MSKSDMLNLDMEKRTNMSGINIARVAAWALMTAVLLNTSGCSALKRANRNSNISSNLVGEWSSNLAGKFKFHDDGSCFSSIGGAAQWSVDFPFLYLKNPDGNTPTFSIIAYDFEQSPKTITLRSQEGFQEVLTQLNTVGAITTKPTTPTSLEIGVGLEPINFSNEQRLGLSQFQGWYVSRVDNGSPAQKAGISRGNFIIKADNKKVYSTTAGDPFAAAKQGKKPGDYIFLTVIRDDGSSTPWQHEVMVKLR